MKLPHLSLNDLFRLPSLAAVPALAGTGAIGQLHERGSVREGPAGPAMLFSSGSGSGDGGYDDDYDDPPYEEPPPQNTRRPPGAQRSRAASAGGGGTGGRQRTVQFQPEERYWTEYLRIALPIIGLLLMIGLFWYWASQLAGDNDGNGDEPIATEPPGTVEMITPPSTPEPTQQVVVPPTSEPEEATDSTPAEEEETPAEEEPTEEAAPEDEAGAAEFAEDDSVVVTAEGEGLNLRAEASSDSESIATLSAGEVLTILSGPEEGGEYQWYEVIVEETADVGWVAADFIEPADVAE